MRVLLGIILGALLLVGVAYYVDSMNTSTVATGPGAATNRTMVNWDVVEENWNTFKVKARQNWVQLRARVG